MKRELFAMSLGDITDSHGLGDSPTGGYIRHEIIHTRFRQTFKTGAPRQCFIAAKWQWASGCQSVMSFPIIGKDWGFKPPNIIRCDGLCKPQSLDLAKRVVRINQQRDVRANRLPRGRWFDLLSLIA